MMTAAAVNRKKFTREMARRAKKRQMARGFGESVKRTAGLRIRPRVMIPARQIDALADEMIRKMQGPKRGSSLKRFFRRMTGG